MRAQYVGQNEMGCRGVFASTSQGCDEIADERRVSTVLVELGRQKGVWTLLRERRRVAHAGVSKPVKLLPAQPPELPVVLRQPQSDPPEARLTLEALNVRSRVRK